MVYEESDFNSIPRKQIEDYARYLMFGEEPVGDAYVGKVVTNQLAAIWAYANSSTTRFIPIWGAILYLYAPRQSYGPKPIRTKFARGRQETPVDPDGNIWPTPYWHEVATVCWQEGRKSAN